MPDLLGGLPVSREDKVGCLRREVRMREKVYPRWVAAGKMKPDESERELRVMKAILSDYEDDAPPPGHIKCKHGMVLAGGDVCADCWAERKRGGDEAII